MTPNLFRNDSACENIENLIQEFVKNPLLKKNYNLLKTSNGIDDKQLSDKINKFLKDQNLWHNYLFLSNHLNSNKSIFDEKLRIQINNLIKLYILSLFLQKNQLKTSNQFIFFESNKSLKKISENILKPENFKRTFDEVINYQSTNPIDISLSPQPHFVSIQSAKNRLFRNSDKFLIQRVYNFSQEGKNLTTKESDQLLIDHLFNFFYETNTSGFFSSQIKLSLKNLEMLDIKHSKIDSLDRFLKSNKLIKKCELLFKNASARMQIPEFESNIILNNSLLNLVKLYVVYQFLNENNKINEQEIEDLKFFRISNLSINPIRFRVTIDKKTIDKLVDFAENKQIEAEESEKKIALEQRIKEAKSRPLIYHHLLKPFLQKPIRTENLDNHQKKSAKAKTTAKSVFELPRELPLTTNQTPALNEFIQKKTQSQLPNQRYSNFNSVDSSVVVALDGRLSPNDLFSKSSPNEYCDLTDQQNDYTTKKLLPESIKTKLTKANVSLIEFLDGFSEKNKFFELLYKNIESFINFFEANKDFKIDENLKTNIDQLCQILESKNFSKNESIDLLADLQSSIDFALADYKITQQESDQTPKSPRLQGDKLKHTALLSPDAITKKLML